MLRTHLFKKKNLGIHGVYVYNVSTGETEGRIAGVCCSASLIYLVSSRPERDPVSKKQEGQPPGNDN